MGHFLLQIEIPGYGLLVQLRSQVVVQIWNRGFFLIVVRVVK